MDNPMIMKKLEPQEDLTGVIPNHRFGEGTKLIQERRYRPNRSILHENGNRRRVYICPKVFDQMLVPQG